MGSPPRQPLGTHVHAKLHASASRLWLITIPLAILIFAGSSLLATLATQHAGIRSVRVLGRAAGDDGLQQQQPSFVIAVTTVARHGNGSYLPDMLNSLACALGSSEPQQPPVIILNGEVPASRHAVFMKTTALQQQHGRRTAGSLGFLTRREMHPQLHRPEFVAALAARAAQDALLRDQGPGSELISALPDTEQDPADRLWWRSKEVLDTAHALETALHAAPTARHVIFLQDDVRLAGGFLDQLRALLADAGSTGMMQPEASSASADNTSRSMDVLTLFSGGGEPGGLPHVHALANPWNTHFGLVGLVFRAERLPGLIVYLRANFAAAPVDWLLNRYIVQERLQLWVVEPNLVQHVGVKSSLAGKVQPIVSGSFVDTQC